MSKSKIEDRLNTMRHKQAQPTDSLTLAEPVKKMKQEQDEIPSLDELSGFKNLAEKQAVLAMYMNHESPDKIQKERERFEKKRAEKRRYDYKKNTPAKEKLSADDTTTNAAEHAAD